MTVLPVPASPEQVREDALRLLQRAEVPVWRVYGVDGDLVLYVDSERVAWTARVLAGRAVDFTEGWETQNDPLVRVAVLACGIVYWR